MILIDEKKALKIIIEELIEITVRLDVFLENSFESLEKTDIKPLKSYYKVIVNEIKTVIDDICDLYTKSETHLDEKRIGRLFKRIDVAFTDIRIIHSYIIFLKGKSIRPETYLLKDEIVQSFKIKDFLNLSIFPNDSYNYEEGIEDIREIIRGEIDIEPKTAILYIPKIETEAPLMWAQLAHEITHAHKQFDKIVMEISEELKEKVEGIHQKRLLRKWGKEIVSDIVALRLLGIGYFLSFINFSIRTGNLITKYENHPSAEIRIRLMAGLLLKEDANPEVNEIIQTYVKLIEYYSEWTRKILKSHEYSTISNMESSKEIKDAMDTIVKNNIPHEIAKLADVRIDDILEKKFDLGEYEKLKDLSEELKEERIISSSRKENDDSIRKAIEKFESSKSKNVYKHVIGRMVEEPNNISEIIGGGWIYRSIYHWDKFDDYFSDKRKKFSTKYEKFKFYIRRYDDILLKSIENSQLHKIFGDKYG